MVQVATPKDVEAEEGDNAMPNSFYHPEAKLSKSQEIIFGDFVIQLRILEEPIRGNVLLQKTEYEYGQTCECDVEEREVDTVIQRLSREVVEKGVEELCREPSHVLVEEVLDENRHAVVVPVPMDQECPLKMFELGEGEVGRPDRGSSLFSDDSEADVGFLEQEDGTLGNA